MKVLSIIIDIVLAVLPFVANKKRKNLEQELEIAKKTIEFLTKTLSPEEKVVILKDAVSNLKAVKDFKAGVSKKLDKASDRLLKKLF